MSLTSQGAQRSLLGRHIVHAHDTGHEAEFVLSVRPAKLPNVADHIARKLSEPIPSIRIYG